MDDDRTQRGFMSEALAHDTTLIIEEVVDGAAALSRLCDISKSSIDMVLLDLHLPRMSGEETLTRMRAAFPALPVIIVTADADIEKAVKLMQTGACDFITKPLQPERLQLCVQQHLTLRSLKNEIARLVRREDGCMQFSDFIGHAGGLAQCVTLARKAAFSDINVLITGESGVGKEWFARAIHGQSHRSGKPFVAINCGAIPEHLMESTLFGHEKGSFTRAIQREIGKFREAEGGTLLLDEIGELKPDMQTKLLRVLQEKESQTVGAGKPMRIRVRILAATHRNLGRDVMQGRFREDLYYRINVLPIHIPPLRERKDDIAALATHLLTRFSSLENKPHLRLSESALGWLCAQSWPGNVRELENLLYRAVVLAEGQIIEQSDLAAMAHRQEHSRTGAEPYIALLDQMGRTKTLEEIQDEVIAAALSRCADNVPEAARLLGMGQSTLYKRLYAKLSA